MSLPEDTMSERRSRLKSDVPHNNNNNKHGQFLKPALPDRTKQHSKVARPPPRAEMVTMAEIEALEKEMEMKTKPPNTTLSGPMPNTPAFWMDVMIADAAFKSSNVSSMVSFTSVMPGYGAKAF